MSKLGLTFACGPYDRMQPLMNGTVAHEGVDLNFIPLEMEEISWRQLKHQEFDCSEASFSHYILSRSRGDDRFIGIPVFTSRCFRHSCVYINVHKGIKEPQDLKGKTVGVPVYPMTAAVWMRGILQHAYGVYPGDMHWRGGGEETPGRVEKLKLELPAEVDYQPVPSDKTLSRMLDEGEIDALFAARAPSCFMAGSPNVKRLFDAYSEVEEEYYRRTGIFPIMHVVVIKRTIYETNPWVAMSLYKACLASKNTALRNLEHTYALQVSLPWLMHHVSYTKKVMGEDWWPYGIGKNRRTIEALCQYSFEQGLSARRMVIEELFAPETFDEFKT
jgi:4,5-dihydroxyphthalate decarboxylase